MEHAQAVAARDRRHAALERARARTQELEQELAKTLAAEQSRTEKEGVRAIDLAQGEAFRREATRRIEVSRVFERAAERDLDAALSVEDVAREALAGSHVDEQAVREHEARFLRNERRQGEERETEDALASGAYRGRFA